MDERLTVKLRELMNHVGAIKASAAAMCSEFADPRDRHTFNSQTVKAVQALNELREIATKIKSNV